MSHVRYTRLENDVETNHTWPHYKSSQGNSDDAELLARLLNNSDETENGGPNVELRTRRPEPRRIYTDSPSPLIDYVEWPVNQGDTLSSISLKSGCTISQLKRANNLMSDQDFYALHIIRIPIKRFGILSEVVHNSKQESAPVPPLLSFEDNASVVSEETADREVRQFMNNVDKGLEEIKEKVTQAPRPPSVSPITVIPVPQTPRSLSMCDGADGGLSFCQAMCLVLLVCICLPVIYILLEEKQLNHTHPVT